MLELQEKPVVLSRKSRKGVYMVEETPSVREIEKMLGFDKVRPIPLTASDAADTQEKDQQLKDWYEYELQKFFEEC
jgi:hypothetical protein